MTNPYATIRAALKASRIRVPAHTAIEREIDEALSAITELERAASEPVAWQYRYSDGKRGSAWLTNNNPPPKEDAAVADVQLLYTAPPIPDGVAFTAKELP